MKTKTIFDVIGNEGIATQLACGMMSCFDDEALYEALYSYYAFELREMPYGIMKGRDGDPVQWIDSRLQEDLVNIGVVPCES